MTFPAQNPRSRVRLPDFLQKEQIVKEEELVQPQDAADILWGMAKTLNAIKDLLVRVLDAGTVIYQPMTVTQTTIQQVQLGAPCFAITVRNGGPDALSLWLGSTSATAPQTINNGEDIEFDSLDPRLEFIGVATQGTNGSAIRIWAQY